MGNVSVEIVEGIADREGVRPENLDVPLYAVLDAEALEALTDGTRDEKPRTPLRVEFPYAGYEVTVDGNGNVSVDETR